MLRAPTGWGKVKTIVAPVCAALILAGCSTPSQTATPEPEVSFSPEPFVPAPVQWVTFACPRAEVIDSNPAGSRVPTGFVPTQAKRCQLRDGAVTTQLLEPVPVELISILGAADQRVSAPSPRACPAQHRPLPYLLLADASGQGFHAWIPLDTYCREPLHTTLTALDALPWRTQK